MPGLRDQRGQASVELVALLPLLAALALGCWQGVLAGQSWWLAGIAARAAARADVVDADPAPAARAALPGAWGRRARVRRAGPGRLVVTVAVPVVVPGLRLGAVGVAVGTGADR